MLGTDGFPWEPGDRLGQCVRATHLIAETTCVLEGKSEILYNTRGILLGLYCRKHEMTQRKKSTRGSLKSAVF